jgi:CRISPR-associated protein Csm2
MKVTFWKDEAKQQIDPTLFSVYAEKLARELAEDNANSKKVNKRTQIRKFYDEVVRLEGEAKTQHWEHVLPMVHMMVAKVAYARGRDLVSDGFVEFIRSSVDQVSTQTGNEAAGKGALKVFANFFEAFMGFYRLHGPNN